jgi:hypothetical protein
MFSIMKSKKTRILFAAAALVLAAGEAFSASQPAPSAGIPVSPLLFGMDVGKPTTPWPPKSASGARLPIKILRMWDNGTSWNLLNPSEGTYNWSRLDLWVDRAEAEHMQVLYVFGIAPTWATSGTPAGKCAESPAGCLPPKDLNADGTGTDAIWQKFVRDLVTRYKGRISYYEVWNEKDARNFWQGTETQSVRMAKDAWGIIKQVDPQAKVLTPSFSHGNSADLDAYLSACGPSCPYEDIVAVHGRAPRKENVQPEAFISIADAFRALMAKHGLGSLPLWDTEAGWRPRPRQGPGEAEVTDPDQQAAYVARAYLIRASEDIGSLVWYAWDAGSATGNSWGGIYDRTTGQASPAAQAYVEVSKWLTGSTLDAPCSANGSVWTCALRRADGTEGLVVWDASQSCSAGNCTTSAYHLTSRYAAYQDIAGREFPISGPTVPIGAKPILLSGASPQP